MERLQKVWNNGATSAFELDGDSVIAFKQLSGSVKVVGLRWIYEGNVHQIETYADPLPDRSGLVTSSQWTGQGTNWMDVINADGSLRFRLFPPPLSERLDHTNAVLEGARPGWSASGIAFGVQAGYKDKVASASLREGEGIAGVGVLLAIDWTTGELKDWKVIPPLA